MRMVSQTRWVGYSLFRPNKCMHQPKGCGLRGHDSQAEYRLWLFGLLNKLSFWIRSLKRIVNWVDALYIFLLLVICSKSNLKPQACFSTTSMLPCDWYTTIHKNPYLKSSEGIFPEIGSRFKEPAAHPTLSLNASRPNLFHPFSQGVLSNEKHQKNVLMKQPHPYR